MKVVNVLGEEWDPGYWPEHFGILSKDLRLLVRPESGVDYLDGED